MDLDTTRDYKFSVSPRVLWTVSITALISGIWQIVTYFLNWDYQLDMEIYRAGAQAFLDNRSLYAEPFEVRGIALPFIYPPFGAAILTPFAVVNSLTAAIGIIVMSAGLTLLCLYFIAQALIPNNPRLAIAFASVMWPLVLLSEPHTMNANFGQINVLVMALCVLDLVPRKRFLPQGTLIGAAAAIKLTPVVLCLYFLMRKDFKAIAWAAASGVLLTAVTALFRLTATKEFFGDMLWKMNSTKDAGVNTAYISNQSIKGMISRWAPSQEQAVAHQALIDGVWLIVVIVTIAACAKVMRMMIQRGLLVDAAMVNAGLMLLISPISWTHHWVWMPLFAMVLTYRFLATPKNPMLLGICAAATWLFCLQIKPHWIFGDLGDEMFQLGVLEKLLLSGYLWLMVFILVSMYLMLRKTDNQLQPSPAD